MQTKNVTISNQKNVKIKAFNCSKHKVDHKRELNRLDFRIIGRWWSLKYLGLPKIFQHPRRKILKKLSEKLNTSLYNSYIGPTERDYSEVTTLILVIESPATMQLWQSMHWAQTKVNVMDFAWSHWTTCANLNLGPNAPKSMTPFTNFREKEKNHSQFGSVSNHGSLVFHSQLIPYLLMHSSLNTFKTYCPIAIET